MPKKHEPKTKEDWHRCIQAVSKILKGGWRDEILPEENPVKWQHEETGRIVDMPQNKNPGNRWFKIQ
jgi:hypothetical protein